MSEQNMWIENPGYFAFGWQTKTQTTTVQFGKQAAPPLLHQDSSSEFASEIPGANNAADSRSTSSFDSEGDDVMSSPNESEIDDNIYNHLAVPSYIIDEAAGLSQYVLLD